MFPPFGNMLISKTSSAPAMSGNWADITPASADNTVTDSNADVVPGAGTLTYAFSTTNTEGGNGNIKTYVNGVNQGNIITWAAGSFSDQADSVVVAAGESVSFTATTTFFAGGMTDLVVEVYGNGVLIDTFSVVLITT